MSVLSRYYFVFLISYFLFASMRSIFGDSERKTPKGQRIVTALFVVFAFIILAFDQNMLSFDIETFVFGTFTLAFAIAGPVITNKFYKRACPNITNAMFFLLSLGFVALVRLNADLAARQLLFAALGFGVSKLIPLVLRIFRSFEKLEKLYILLCLGLVGIVTIVDFLAALTGIPLVAVDEFGATRWLSIAGFTFQSSEFVKPIFVVYLACAFRTKPSMGKLVFAGLSSAALIGILVLQRDLGSALMFFTIFMVMLYATTGSKALGLAGLGAMAAASVAAYQIFPHLRVRVAAWADPWAVIDGQGFQVAQSLFAIGTWGPFGIGLNRGWSNGIPVVERDVIFSAIAEEFGWLFALLLIFIFGIILLRGTDIARRSKRPLYALMALGFSVFLAFQAFVSIGGNIKLIPMTGITLPFLSYGGSSVFVSILMVGMLNWLNGEINVEEAEVSDELSNSDEV